MKYNQGTAIAGYRDVGAQAGSDRTGGGVEGDSAGMVCGRDRIQGADVGVGGAAAASGAKRLLCCWRVGWRRWDWQKANWRRRGMELGKRRCWRGGCASTPRRRRWVSERLGMGDESRVTQAMGRLKRKGPPRLERLKRRLAQVYESNHGEVEV
jgi:hypothetical protein